MLLHSPLGAQLGLSQPPSLRAGPGADVRPAAWRREQSPPGEPGAEADRGCQAAREEPAQRPADSAGHGSTAWAGGGPAGAVVRGAVAPEERILQDQVVEVLERAYEWSNERKSYRIRPKVGPT